MSFKGQMNTYTCRSCGAAISTVDLDDGVTPFLIGCKMSDGCKGMMQSAMYRPRNDAPPAQWEWFKPTDLKGYSDEMRDHVEAGGLVLRHFRDHAMSESEAKPGKR